VISVSVCLSVWPLAYLNKSPLPLTDPYDAVTGDRHRSPVYHKDRPPKLTAPETISRSRDMVGAQQNLNGLCDHARFRDGLPFMC